MTSRQYLLRLSIPQCTAMSAAFRQQNSLPQMGSVPIGLRNYVDMAGLEKLEALAYRITPKNTREWVTREAILDKVLRLKRIAAGEGTNKHA